MAAQVDEIMAKVNYQAPEQLHVNVAAALKILDEQAIEESVAMEMEKLRNLYDAEENAYVQENLKLNPIVEQRRPSQPGADPKRAEACRRSRYNGKVKKASLRYRHQFLTQKLRQSAPIMQQMQDMVANLEHTILTDPRNRIDKSELQKIKKQFGIDKFQYDLTTLIKIENDNM